VHSKAFNLSIEQTKTKGGIAIGEYKRKRLWLQEVREFFTMDIQLETLAGSKTLVQNS
jgi:hypothetical protein